MISESVVVPSQQKCCPVCAIFQKSLLFTLLTLPLHPLNDVRQVGLNRGELLFFFAVLFERLRAWLSSLRVRVKPPVVCVSHPPLWYADLSVGSLLPQFVNPTLLSGTPILINGLNSPWQKSSRHSTVPASRRTALRFGHILPVCTRIAPCPAGAGTVSVLAGLSPRTVKGWTPIGEKRRSYARPSTHQRQFSCYRFRC